MSDRGDSKPAAPASASDHGAEYLAKGLYADRERIRGFQRYFARESPEWQQSQAQVDAIDDKLLELSERAKSVTTKEEPNSPGAVTADVDVNTTPALPVEQKARGGAVFGSRNEDTIRRRTLVAKNIELRSDGLCHVFDTASIPLPPGMSEAGTWVKASRGEHRHAVESLISRDRKAVRKPTI